jgi:hypothetical protein
MKVTALTFTDNLPEEYQRIHIEAFAKPFIFLKDASYLLHPNSGGPIQTLVVEGRTNEGHLIGFFIIIIQDLIGNIWSICKTKKYPMQRFFQKLLVFFLQNIYCVPYLVMLSSRETIYDMSETARLCYYSSIGFRITATSVIKDEQGNIHTVIEHDYQDFVDVSGARLPLTSVHGKTYDLRMLAKRDDILRLH